MIKDTKTGDIWMKTKLVDAKGSVTFGFIQVYDEAKKQRHVTHFCA
jgi:hypothetical protein